MFWSERINQRYIHRSIDGGVSMEVKDSNYLPMIFIEIDKHKLDSEYDHKDLAKIAILLGAAL